MKHTFIDKYAGKNSVLHNYDARLKLFSLLLLILLIVGERHYNPRFLAYFGLVSGLVTVSKIPVKFFLKKAFVLLPFVFLITVSIPFINGEKLILQVNLNFINLRIYEEGLTLFITVIIKSILSIICFILLIATTPFNRILASMR